MNSPILESESEFEDSPMNTPITLRERSTDNVYVRTTTSVPLKDHLDHVGFITPTKPKISEKSSEKTAFEDEEREVIRHEKLITDNNEFSPTTYSRSPARRIRASLAHTALMGLPKHNDVPNFKENFQRAHRNIPMSLLSVHPRLNNNVLLERGIEFDPSDRDLPEKSPQVFGSPRRPQLEESHKHLAKTPTRLSPLRNEIIPLSGSVKTTAEELADMSRSGALLLKSAQEIQDQINMSMDRMRDGESDARDDESDDEEILEQLDHFLPKTALEEVSVAHTPGNLTGKSGSPGRNPNNQIQRNGHTPLLNFSEIVTTLTQESQKKKFELPSEPRIALEYEKLPSPDYSQPTSLKVAKRRTAPTNRKLSGRYARDVLRKRKLTASGKYQSWLYDKWDKLRRLVELSIPNLVIINNTVVLRELGCTKEELAQRVKFLERHQE